MGEACNTHGMLVKGVMFTIGTRSSGRGTATTIQFFIEVPSHNPHYSPCDFLLWRAEKPLERVMSLIGRWHPEDSGNYKATTTTDYTRTPSTRFWDWDKCLNSGGDYFKTKVRVLYDTLLCFFLVSRNRHAKFGANRYIRSRAICKQTHKYKINTPTISTSYVTNRNFG